MTRNPALLVFMGLGLMCLTTVMGENSSNPSPPKSLKAKVVQEERNTEILSVSPEVKDELKKIVQTLATGSTEESKNEDLPLATQTIQGIKGIFTAQNIIMSVSIALRISVILLAYIVLRRLFSRLVVMYTNRIKNSRDISSDEYKMIMNTASPIIQSAINWVLMTITLLLILSEFKVNIMPIIYSFSVLGLAVSIGSQTLVKDLINGLLTLLEGNMAVGDRVTIGSSVGNIESISLRCIHLRRLTGELETIPFSEVSVITNHSRDFTVAKVLVIVGFEAKVDDVERIFRESFESIKSDPKLRSMIENDLSFYGVEEIGEYGVKISASAKVKLDPSRTIQVELNRRILEGFQRGNIPFASPPGGR
jgi:small-conductance mechanosensitive channel